MELELPVDFHSGRDVALFHRGRAAAHFRNVRDHDRAAIEDRRQCDRDAGELPGADARRALERVDGKRAGTDHRHFRAQEWPDHSRQGLAHRLDHRQLAAHAGTGDVLRRFALSAAEIQRGIGPPFDVDDVPGGRGTDGAGPVPFHVPVRRARDQPANRRDLAGRLRLEPGLHAVYTPQVVRGRQGSRAGSREDPLVEDGSRGSGGRDRCTGRHERNPHRCRSNRRPDNSVSTRFSPA